MSAHVGDWVQISRTVLEAHQRTGKLPDDTRAVPFVSWSKGFLVGLAADGEPDEGGAQLGDEVAIESVIGRRLTGTLVAVNPGYTHGFGSAYVPELATIAPQALAILAGGRPMSAGSAATGSVVTPRGSAVTSTGDAATSYDAVMARNGEIMRAALGVDYATYESGSIAFDYDRLMSDVGYSLDDVRAAQRRVGVGDTPLLELRNLTELARRCSADGLGARIFVKDEQCNPSGSYKDRRASMSIVQARELGYRGVAAATSGNYGAAVASQAAMAGLQCVIAQECYDSAQVGQPEILEKMRKCEALGAEVLQLSVGPELFYSYLLMLEETGFFNASLYSAYGIAGVEPLGVEIVEQCMEHVGKAPEYVIATNAGGGNLTGTARGLALAGASTKVYAASVDLHGLSMASDRDFNRKSFTTGHTGFGMPYATDPDHSDVPRSAARPLRYMDEYLLVKQGEVFAMTELLARLEGMERGPAGNTSLVAAFALARTLPAEEVIVVQETEYTGAGKHPLAQLAFAREMGVDVTLGDPADEVPGRSIVLPDHPRRMVARYAPLPRLRTSYIRNAVDHVGGPAAVGTATAADIAYLMAETRTEETFVRSALSSLGVGTP